MASIVWIIVGYFSLFDFGFAGLTVIPILIGFIISESYYFFHWNPNLALLSVTLISFAIITVTFNSDPLTRLNTILPFVAIALSPHIFIKRKPSYETSANSLEQNLIKFIS